MESEIGMILDETFEYEIKRPFQVSSKGDFFFAKTLEFLPPQPQMAKETFKLGRYFSAMNKEVAAFASSVSDSTAVSEAREAQAQKIVSGSNVEAIHEEYKDDDPEAKEAKLQEIENAIDSITQMLDMCDGVDLYALVTDFGKMVIYSHKCFIKGMGTNESEFTEPMTRSLWENNVDPKDRLAAAIRYSCFFGLTSSLVR